MESLKSQLSLRSLDVEGRSPGTGRPSVFGTAGNSSGATRFASLLERDLDSHRARPTGVEDRVEAQVADRIRAGRDAARDDSASLRSRDESRVKDDDPMQRERAAERRSREPVREDAREVREDPRSSEPGRRRDTNGPERRLSGRERTVAAADAADAEGAGDAAPQSLPSQIPPAEAPDLVADPGDALVPTAANLVPQAAATPLALQTAARPVAPSITAVAAGRAAEPGAPRSADAAPPREAPTPADVKRAEAVLRQLRASVQAGARDAIVELRPSELGRISVHLRVEAGSIEATMRADRVETLAILEAHLPELRAWLSQDGLDVREVDLALLEEDDSFADFLEGDSAQGGGDREGESSGDAQAGSRGTGATESSTGPAPTTTSTPGETAGIDLLV